LRCHFGRSNGLIPSNRPRCRGDCVNRRFHWRHHATRRSESCPARSHSPVLAMPRLRCATEEDRLSACEANYGWLAQHECERTRSIATVSRSQTMFAFGSDSSGTRTCPIVVKSLCRSIQQRSPPDGSRLPDSSSSQLAPLPERLSTAGRESGARLGENPVSPDPPRACQRDLPVTKFQQRRIWV